MGEDPGVGDDAKKPLIKLSEARLELDAFDEDWGVLLVEGPDDWRLFRPRVFRPSQLIHCEGREIVLAAYRASTVEDRARMVFVVDCDFGIPLKTLTPGPSLVITRNVDSEADLLELGLFEQIVNDALPSVITDIETADEIVSTVRSRVVEIALVLGQIRRVAKPLGVATQSVLEDLKYGRWRVKRSASLDRDVMVERIGMALDPRFCGMSGADFAKAVASQPTGYQYCNGHDMVNAMQYVLAQDFRSSITRAEIYRFLRGAAGDFFWDWQVPARIERWERETGRQIFKNRIR